MIKAITYDGTAIFGNFGLYEVDEEVDIEASKESVFEAFSLEHKNEIIDLLKSVGLKYQKLEYYSPKYYNFANDSIDLTIRITNRPKLINYINKNKEAIQELLSNNRSYDGYISTTKSYVSEIIDDINDLDIMVLVLLFKSMRSKYIEDGVNWLLHENLTYSPIEERV